MSTLAKLKELAALGVGVHISAEQLQEALRELEVSAGRAGFVAGYDKCWYSVYGTQSPEYTVPYLADNYAESLL